MKTMDLQEKTTAVALTRKEKLSRWAELVRQQPGHLLIFHGMENWDRIKLQCPLGPSGSSAFTIAAGDEVFKAAGLKGDSARDAMEFFELSQGELHSFSCDCGGGIDTKNMASRIDALANGDRTPPTMFSRILRF